MYISKKSYSYNHPAVRKTKKSAAALYNTYKDWTRVDTSDHGLAARHTPIKNGYKLATCSTSSDVTISNYWNVLHRIIISMGGTGFKTES